MILDSLELASRRQSVEIIDEVVIIILDIAELHINFQDPLKILPLAIQEEKCTLFWLFDHLIEQLVILTQFLGFLSEVVEMRILRLFYSLVLRTICYLCSLILLI